MVFRELSLTRSSGTPWVCGNLILSHLGMILIVYSRIREWVGTVSALLTSIQLILGHVYSSLLPGSLRAFSR